MTDQMEGRPGGGMNRPPLRERKRQKARDALFETAYRKFLEKGFHRTTVAEIADEADVSPRTFFRYFGAKEDAVFARSDAHLTVISEDIESRPADEPDHLVLEHALLEYARYLDGNREWVQPLGRLVAETPELNARRADEFAGWARGVAGALARRHGATEPTLENEVFAAAALGAFKAVFDRWATGHSDGTLEDNIKKAFEILALG